MRRRNRTTGQLASSNHATEVLAALKRHMNPRTRNLFPRWKELGRELGLSEATVMRGMRYLLKVGLIKHDFLPAMNPNLPENVGFTVIAIPEEPAPAAKPAKGASAPARSRKGGKSAGR